jgi:glycosyltransferase involved in cell wall biosynthesis
MTSRDRGSGPARPSFSVVIAAYQAAATVGDAVRSALEQTHPAFEVIVSDDGSTDDLDAALGPYRDDIVYLRNENRGPAAARNAAVEAARGEFIVVLDADDAYEPGRLAALAELSTREPDLDILTTDAFLERDGDIVGHFYRGDFPFPFENQRDEILRRCFLFAPAVRRQRLQAVGGFDESFTIGEDWDCWLRVILDGARAGLVDEPLVYYRLHAGSLTSDRARSLRARVTVMEKAARRTDLTAGEMERLARGLAIRSRAALVAEAEAALDSHSPGARRRCLGVVFARKMPARARLKALVGLVSPALANSRRER